MTETLLNQIDKLNEYLHLESDINKKDFKYINTMLQSMRNEAINYTRCCETLKAGDTPTFKQWLKLKKIPKIDNLYYYKGTHYFLIEINNIYKEWCRLHL